MNKIFILLAMTASALAQESPSVTPVVDSSIAAGTSEEALRERVRQFYQFHVEGKFRAADALVADDSKDAFFAAAKTQYKKCVVGKVTLAADHETATVNTSCDSTWSFHGQRRPVVVPAASNWKLQGGSWFWYQPPYTGKVQTPFGTMTVDPDGRHQGDSRGIPADPGAIVPGMLTQVRADKNSVNFIKDQPGHQEVTIHNAMQGLVRVSVDESHWPELRIDLSSKQLNANEDAKLVFDYKPGATRDQRVNIDSFVVNIHVNPTKQIIPLRLNFGSGFARKSPIEKK